MWLQINKITSNCAKPKINVAKLQKSPNWRDTFIFRTENKCHNNINPKRSVKDHPTPFQEMRARRPPEIKNWSSAKDRAPERLKLFCTNASPPHHVGAVTTPLPSGGSKWRGNFAEGSDHPAEFGHFSQSLLSFGLISIIIAQES